MSAPSYEDKIKILEENAYRYYYDLGLDEHVWTLNRKLINKHYNKAKVTHDVYQHYLNSIDVTESVE